MKKFLIQTLNHYLYLGSDGIRWKSSQDDATQFTAQDAQTWVSSQLEPIYYTIIPYED
jgi:hypothetical protein